MSKTQEELNQLKNEYEAVKTKLKELSEDELQQIAGGFDPSEHGGCFFCSLTSMGNCIHAQNGTCPYKDKFCPWRDRKND